MNLTTCLYSVISLILLYACYLDIRDRRVPNIVWVAMACVTLPFWNLETTFLVVIISFVLYLTGTIGAADAKCFMVLSFSVNTLVIMLVSFLLFPLFIPARKWGGYDTYPFLLPLTTAAMLCFSLGWLGYFKI